jgi:toluene monooxygenase system protein A
MLPRDRWLDLARKLDWEFTYVNEEDVFPKVTSGEPWLRGTEWQDWEEPFRTSYREYVTGQHEKDAAVYAVKDIIGRIDNYQHLPKGWLDGLKLHSATLPLAEFAAVVGNLRAARFGRASAWRMMATLGALDEYRHTQIPLMVMHELVRFDPQFDWTHKFYHSNNWVAIAARHLADELLLLSDPIEFAIATNFVFETGFTNLQFIGLSSFARETGDHMFEAMIKSIQTDEARHAQIGPAVLATVIKHDPSYVQRLVDKWFWRSWVIFSVVTGFQMDYLTPLEHRKYSFKEFVEEWVIQQFLESLERHGLKRPWYWDTFLESLDYFHHMVYLSAYTYRATVWFNFVLPSPDERHWLMEKYPKSWDQFEPRWQTVVKRWEKSDPGLDFAVHGTAIVSFCDLCQLVLCGGRPDHNTANTMVYDNKKYIFCSDPCRKIFEQEPERYKDHKDLVKRVLAGEAPGNVLELITKYFGLDFDTWGKDTYAGVYPWLNRKPSAARRSESEF